MQLPHWSWSAALLAHALSIPAANAETAGSGKFSRSVTLFYEPIQESAAGAHLATVDYDPKTLTAFLSSWTPPSLDALKFTTPHPTSAPLYRVLLPSGSSTATSLATFNSSLSQTIELWLSPDGSGDIISASISGSIPTAPLPAKAELAKSKTKPKTQSELKAKLKAKLVVPAPSVQVNIVAPGYGPSPKLTARKPPVVGADGREVPGAEEVPEKSFFQKYWWAFIPIALLLMGGGGAEK